jgi:fumarate reductase flavoprotein subunit
LREDGSAIDGLYAAGTTTGGLEGGEPAAYLGGLTKAGVQGLCAAEHIARTLKT